MGIRVLILYLSISHLIQCRKGQCNDCFFYLDEMKKGQDKGLEENEMQSIIKN